MKRACENCGGIIIYPPEKKVVFNAVLKGWVCDACEKSLMRQVREWEYNLKDKQKNERNRKNN